MRALRPVAPGGEVASLPTFPFSSAVLSAAGVVLDWPFPQLFLGRSVALLATETAVFSVNLTTWALTAVSLVSPGGGAATITAGGVWHFIDFHTTWILT